MYEGQFFGWKHSYKETGSVLHDHGSDHITNYKIEGHAYEMAP